jgi:hypothetical protein
MLNFGLPDLEGAGEFAEDRALSTGLPRCAMTWNQKLIYEANWSFEKVTKWMKGLTGWVWREVKQIVYQGREGMPAALSG